jgi:hypothetical protein
MELQAKEKIARELLANGMKRELIGKITGIKIS